MAARPSFQFYPADWRADLRLQRCSLSARALLIELMCMMHEGTPYGHLATDGEPFTDKEVAVKVGVSTRELRKLLSELESRNVLERTPEGTLISRRMIRDEEVRQARANGGKAGAVHGSKGAEHGQKGGRPVTKKAPYEENGRGVSNPPSKPPPSSSSSLRDNYKHPTTDSARSDFPKTEPEKPNAEDRAIDELERNAHRRPPPTPATAAKSQQPFGSMDPKLAKIVAAGWFSMPPTDWKTQLDAWEKVGADLEKTVIPAIREVAERLERTGQRQPFKLKFYDSAVRQALAAELAENQRFAEFAAAHDGKFFEPKDVE